MSTHALAPEWPVDEPLEPPAIYDALVAELSDPAADVPMSTPGDVRLACLAEEVPAS